jgi:hypothetical protein
MSDETANSTETIAATTQAAATTPAPTAFTPEQQEMVNKIVQERLAKDRAVRPAQAPVKTEPKQERSSESDLRASIEALTLRTERAEFNAAAAEVGIPKSASEDLFALSRVQKPENLSEWLGAKRDVFGLKPPTANQSQTPGTPEWKPPPGAPNAPVKVDSITADGLPNPWALTAQQIDELGPRGCADMLEKLTTVGRARLGTPPPPKLPARK